MKVSNMAKRLVAAFAALVMALAVVTPAFAATITIDNAASNETYTAYKLFDVSSSGEKYSYSTDNQSLVTALQNGNLNISFTKAANQNVWYVSGIEDEAKAAALAQYIHTNWDDTFRSLIGGTSYQSTVSEEGVVTIDTDGATGYFYVTSSLGSLCALHTAQDTQTIHEKNSVPTVTKQVKEDNGDTWGTSATVDDIDTVFYKLTVNTGSNSYGAGTGVDGNYVIEDQLPDGITYKDGSVSIDNWTLGTDYNVSYENGTLTITLLSTGALSKLTEDNNLEITYEATASSSMKVGTANTNNVTLKYKNQTSTSSASVYTYSIGGTAEDATITKVDGSDHATALKGVKFVLSKGSGESTKYATFDSNGFLKDWVDTQDEATELETDENGHIFASGLDADTYVLTETETLPGYNLLDGTINVVINPDGTVTYDLTSDDKPAGSSIVIENKAGSLLPSTGGMGTTALYAVGAVLVVGAGVTLVVRRRAHHEA